MCIILASTNVKMYLFVYMVGARLVFVGITFMGTSWWVGGPKSIIHVKVDTGVKDTIAAIILLYFQYFYTFNTSILLMYVKDDKSMAQCCAQTLSKQ